MPKNYHSGEPYRSVVTVKESNEEFCDVQFSFDKNNRRQVENAPSTKNDTAVLFIGCSFTYGEGVDGNETFASLVSKEIKYANVYNLEVGASSPSQIYYDMTHSRENF